MGFDAATQSHLWDGWTTASTTIDQELQKSLPVLQARARDMYFNSSYVRGWVHRTVNNVVGHEGARPKFKSKRVADRWAEWCKKGNCTMDGQSTFVEQQQLAVMYCIREGEILFRQHASRSDGFRIEGIEPIRLDHHAEDGRGTSMGVEVNRYHRPIAYHVLESHQAPFAYYGSAKRVRVPASSIIHVYERRFTSQRRGIPPLHAAIDDMYQAKEYDKAELSAARYLANSPGFFRDPDNELGGEDSTDSAALPDEQSGPGEYRQIGENVEFITHDSKYPHADSSRFKQSTLQGVAASVLSAYHSFGNNLQGVTYSSARIGTLEERDAYKNLQVFLRDNFLIPVFDQWVTWEVLSGRLPSNALQERPEWQFRGWPWVDPLKETQAHVMQIKERLTTRGRVVAERGLDYSRIIEDLVLEQEIEKKAGFIHEATEDEPAASEVPDAERDDPEEPGQ